MLDTASLIQSSQQIEDLFKDQKSMLLLLKQMKDGVLICDKEGHIILFNQVLGELLDLNPAILNQSSENAVPNPHFQESLDEVLKQGRAVTQALILTDPQQMKQYFQIHLVPLVVTGAVDGCVAIFHDETAIRRTEKMRRDFVANVSHELRTPLSAIHGYAETLLDGAIEDKEVAWEFVKVIFRHSQRLSQLVADLLDLSKLESPDFTPDLDPMDLRPLIKRVMGLVATNAEAKDIALSLDLPSDLPLVMANTSNLEQVFTNLCDNAIKYTGEGGSVNLVVGTRPGGWVQIDVKDTGIGIDPKHAQRLFERFYRVDKARSRDMGGTGLGLSIVKHIIQYHGGDIWVHSQPNRGSTFSFTLKQAAAGPLTESSK